MSSRRGVGRRTRFSTNGAAQKAAREATAYAAVLALSPTYQFRADTVTLSGSNVATIPNRLGSDALVLSAGTLAAPASDALFGGAQSIVFTGSQKLSSSLAANAWKFLHDGTGCEVFLVSSRTTTAGANIHVATNNASARTAGAGIDLNFNHSAPFAQVNISNGSALIENGTITPTTPVGSALYLNWYWGSADPIGFGFFEDGTIRRSSTPASPSSANPVSTLLLGGDTSGLFATMRFSELLIFSRVLHEYERQIVREYISARYGITAPSLTGADRQIMSLKPFSYVTADQVTSSAGNVTAFLDRARPGHTFAQATTANQVPNPATSALFNNQLVATASAAQLYASSLPASAWSFTADGTGFDSAWLGRSTDTTGTRVLFGTTSAANAQGISIFRATQTYSGTIYKSGAAVAAVTAGNVSVNTPFLMRVSHSTSGSPQYDFKVSGTADATGSYSSSAGVGAPATTLQLLANSGPAAPWNGDFAGAVFFNRVLSAPDLATLNQALLTKYGVAA